MWYYRVRSFHSLNKLEDVGVVQSAKNLHFSPDVLSFLSILNFGFLVCFNCDKLAILGMCSTDSSITALADYSSHFITLQLIDFLEFSDVSLRLHTVESLGLLEVLVSKYLWQCLPDTCLV